MALTKIQITEEIQDRLGYSRSKCSEIVEDLLECMKDCMEKGEDVMISGFGKFCVKDKNARKGRNPSTGNEMMLGKRRVVVFKCSGKLKEAINQ